MELQTLNDHAFMVRWSIAEKLDTLNEMVPAHLRARIAATQDAAKRRDLEEIIPSYLLSQIKQLQYQLSVSPRPAKGGAQHPYPSTFQKAA